LIAWLIFGEDKKNFRRDIFRCVGRGDQVPRIRGVCAASLSCG
jgi:hypothetical protein